MTLITRQIKDSVFGALFNIPEYLLQLYKVLYPEDTEITEKDLTNVTISNILTDGLYNDLSFIVKGKKLILVEAQSKWSDNIVLRALFYIAEIQKRLLVEKGIEPCLVKASDVLDFEAYLLYTGKRRKLPEIVHYSDFHPNSPRSFLDAKVYVLQVDEHKTDIASQYYAFTRICDTQVSKLGRTRQAIKTIIDICQRRNILSAFLESRKMEVISIMEMLFDQERAVLAYIRREVKEAEERATAAAMKRGMAKGMEKGIEDGLKKGMEIGIEKGKIKGIEEGRAEGRAEGRVEGMVEGETIATIEMCQEFGVSFMDTIQRLMNKFGISEIEARKQVEQYWK